MTNPTHHPNRDELAQAAGRYWTVQYRLYHSKYMPDTHCTLHFYTPSDRDVAPTIVVREQNNLYQIVRNALSHLPHDCNEWCCVVARMVGKNRVEAA